MGKILKSLLDIADRCATVGKILGGYGMPYAAAAIANYFIRKGWEEGSFLTPMKALKLVYFAHGWHLALFNKALIDEPVEAWPYGPVVSSLYHELKGYGDGPITRLACSYVTRWPRKIAIPAQIAFEDSKTSNFLDRIWNVYGQYSGIALSNMTHAEGTPWKDISKRCGGKIPKDTLLPDPEIKRYFESLADARRPEQ